MVACDSPDRDQVIETRSANPYVKTAIMGALLYLDDHQIRDREGIRSCSFDSSIGDGCVTAFKINSLQYEECTFELPTPIPGIVLKNEIGEWASYVNFLPAKIGNADGESVVTLQDSSLFMTAAITYPLYLFKEDNLPESSKVIRDMRKQAMQCMNNFKRGDAYNFWLEFPGKTSDAPVTGPFNIPSDLIGFFVWLKTSPELDPLRKISNTGLDTAPDWWLAMCIDKELNPYGADAFFNMPDDADDTSVAVVIQKLHSGEFDPESADPYYSAEANFMVDEPALSIVDNYRDLNRSKEYFGKDDWKGKDSGAYLTWLKDETLSAFDTPETGVIPLGVNNVDCVVNANVIFAKALLGENDDAGYEAAIQLVVKAIDDSQWPECGLYYPQKMIFPFSVTRAFRDGGADHPDLTNAMHTLLVDMVSLQNDDGSFPGGADPTTDLSTALGVISLLNIGRQIADDAAYLSEYETAIKKGIRYLLRHQRPVSLHNTDTFNRDLEPKNMFDKALSWDSGLFFSSSYQDTAHWRSEAYTVAIVLEALSKYVLAYDYGDVSIQNGRKIHVQSYSRSAFKAAKDFQLAVQ